MAHRFERNDDMPALSVLCKMMQALRGPRVFIFGRPSLLDHPRVPVQRAAVGFGAEFRTDINHPLVPGKAERAVRSIIGGEIAFIRPDSARPGEQVEPQGGGVSSCPACIKDNVVAHRKLEHVQTQLHGTVEKGKLPVGPSVREEITVRSVLHFTVNVAQGCERSKRKEKSAVAFLKHFPDRGKGNPQEQIQRIGAIATCVLDFPKIA
jgi:hypothetical protein